MNRTISIKSNLSTAEISVDDNSIVELYADAVVEQIVGIPVTKLLFYVGTGVNGSNLTGKAAFRLTIPTSNLVDMARQLLLHVEKNKDKLNSAITVYSNSVNNNLVK